MPLEINKELVVSSAHIDLKAYNDLTSDKITNYSNDEIYWRVHVDGSLDGGESLPTSIHNLLLLAKDLECKWLVIDSDGLEIEYLPTYDW